MVLELETRYSMEHLKQLNKIELKVNDKKIKINIKHLSQQTSAPYIEFFLNKDGQLAFAGHGDMKWV